jgi:hypothetical protein
MAETIYAGIGIDIRSFSDDGQVRGIGKRIGKDGLGVFGKVALRIAGTQEKWDGKKKSQVQRIAFHMDLLFMDSDYW